MAVCKQCGKKVFFGHLNKDRLCARCVERNEIEAQAALKAAIESEYIEEIYVGRDRSDEETACRYFIDEFVKLGKRESKFRIVQEDSAYSSLQYAMTEILRVRMTEHVRWIAIRMDKESMKTYMDDLRFEWQVDKDQRFWKSYFKNMVDLFQYTDVVTGVPLIDYMGIGRTLKDGEKEAIDLLYDLFIKNGADPERFYIYDLSNAVELIYASLGGSVRIKAGDTCGGPLVVDRYSLESIAEMPELEAEYIPMKIAQGEQNEMDMHRYRKFERD